jgi:hypothetical protein
MGCRVLHGPGRAGPGRSGPTRLLHCGSLGAGAGSTGGSPRGHPGGVACTLPGHAGPGRSGRALRRRLRRSLGRNHALCSARQALPARPDIRVGSAYAATAQETRPMRESESRRRDRRRDKHTAARRAVRLRRGRGLGSSRSLPRGLAMGTRTASRRTPGRAPAAPAWAEHETAACTACRAQAGWHSARNLHPNPQRYRQRTAPLSRDPPATRPRSLPAAPPSLRALAGDGPGPHAPPWGSIGFAPRPGCPPAPSRGPRDGR